MGYEIIYSYHERLEEGGYNKDEIKELKRRIGEPFDEVPLEKLASAITQQLARRDIWVTNWEVFEYKKQKLNCRETRGGIVIKNKKFILDNHDNLVSEEIPEPTGVPPHNLIVRDIDVPAASAVRRNKNPIKYVVLDSEGVIQEQGRRVPVETIIRMRGLKFSPNKRYPVFQEMADPTDKRLDMKGQPSLERRMLYVMLDDRQKEVTVSQDYFAPDVNLLGGSSAKDLDNGPKLMFEGEMQNDNLELRRK